MAKSKHYYIRKTHRYLGVILGIQFLMWTIGGLYFSWSDIDEIYGDFQKKSAPLLSSNIKFVSPSLVIDNINRLHNADSIVSFQIIEILGKPYYQIRSINTRKDISYQQIKTATYLADATTGAVRDPLTKDEAVQVAQMRFNGEPKIKSVEYLNTTSRHHEYRENPLPAYAVTFEYPLETTVYVASELGTVQKFRNDKWRIFDFLYMMHTMDYESRDNFNNLLLRIFSLFGVITVLSGFVLYFISSKTIKSFRK